MPHNGERIQHLDPSKPFRHVLSADTLSGTRVRNPKGEELGSIKQIMIDIPSGRVAYAVLTFGGFLGLGDKLFAIPWEAMTLNEDQQCFLLDADRSFFENAPGFDKNNWPETPDTRWSGGLGVNASSTSSVQSNAPIGTEAAAEYNRGLKSFAASTEVESRARDAELAVNSPEDAQLKQAEQIGKERSKVEGHER